MLYQLSKEVNVGYIILKQKLSGSNTLDYLKDITGRPEIKYYIEDSFTQISSQLAESTLKFIFSVPMRLLDIMLTFFFTFFLLKDGPKYVNKIEKGIPLDRSKKKEILKSVHGVVYAIINGFFVIALVEGILGAIAFKLFGVASPIFWGLVIAFLTFIPFVGAAVIWIPATIIQAFNGHWFNFVGLLIFGIIITYIDTFLKPKVIGDKAAIHPAIILIGLLGGLKLMGFIGIIIGPLVLSLFITFIKTFAKK